MDIQIFQKKNSVEPLLERDKFVEKAVRAIVNCGQCHKCCEHSSAFVLSHEIETLRKLNVPLRIIGDTHFLAVDRKGRCMNLTADNECCIYEHRPTSCRLFPYYIINRPDIPRTWVIYDFCPNESKKRFDGQAWPGLMELKMVVARLERMYTSCELEEMVKTDNAIAKCDRLEVGFRGYLPILRMTDR